jgi:hypothetical protein
MLAPTPKHGSLDGLIQWLEQKPRDGEYDYSNGECCLIRQYMHPADFGAWPPEMQNMYRGGDVGHQVASGYPRTFGGALTRAYAARIELLR